MKRIISLFLVFAVIFVFCGCQTDQTDDEDLQKTEKGAFWTDDAVMVLQNESEIDAEAMKTHCENKGIIAVFSGEMATVVQDALGPMKVTVDFTGEEKAVLFYINKYGTYTTYCLESNASSNDSEIDDMIHTIKTERQ